MTSHQNAMLMLVLCSACSGSTVQQVGSQYVKTGTFGPNGGTLTVTASDDAALQGTQIVIPPGALSAQMTIQIGVTNQAVVSSGALGPIIDFEPSGTAFTLPAIVTIPVSLGGLDPSRVGVMAVEPNGSSHDITAVTVTSGGASSLATFQVSGFTHYGCHVESETDAGCTRACGDDATCGSSDGCGGTCDANCDDGGCTPDCGDAATCGSSDGCGGTCNANCDDGGCTPQCGDGGTCGSSDGCGGTCNQNCDDGGCTPDCGDDAGCGSSDGCGGTCTQNCDAGSCTYPMEVDGGNLFPDVALGDGWINFTGAVDADAGMGAEPDALLQLHCSGERYALIDVSGVWCIHSQEFALDVPVEYEAGWLAQGGLVLTVLEGNGSDSAPATDADLTSWATTYQTNYSLVNDPEENLEVALAPIMAWPAQYIVRLSDMQIVEAVLGAGDAFYEDYTQRLAADGGM